MVSCVKDVQTGRQEGSVASWTPVRGDVGSRGTQPLYLTPTMHMHTLVHTLVLLTQMCPKYGIVT